MEDLTLRRLILPGVRHCLEPIYVSQVPTLSFMIATCGGLVGPGLDLGYPLLVLCHQRIP